MKMEKVPNFITEEERKELLEWVFQEEFPSVRDLDARGVYHDRLKVKDKKSLEKYVQRARIRFDIGTQRESTYGHFIQIINKGEFSPLYKETLGEDSDQHLRIFIPLQEAEIGGNLIYRDQILPLKKREAQITQISKYYQGITPVESETALVVLSLGFEYREAFTWKYSPV